MKYQISLCLLFVLTLSIAHSQLIEDDIQTVLDSTYEANSEAVGILVHVEAPDQAISWSGAAGISSRNKSQALHKNQPTLIASVTKTYVSAAVLRLVEIGKFELDDSIRKLISKRTRKKLQTAGYDVGKITVRHLLSHTSGLTDYVDDGYFTFVEENPTFNWTRDAQIDRAMVLASPVAPETNFSYGDINYLLLSEIIEKNTNRPFYLAMRDLLKFSSLGLQETWFVDLESKPKGVKSFAHQYSTKFSRGSDAINPSWDLFGGGGLAATSKDVARFFQCLFEGKIIEDEIILAEMYRYVPPIGQTRNYCLGLYHIPSFFGETVYYHGGFWGTDVMYLPKYNIAIFVSTLRRESRDINPVLANTILQLLKVHYFNK